MVNLDLCCIFLGTKILVTFIAQPYGIIDTCVMKGT